MITVLRRAPASSLLAGTVLLALTACTGLEEASAAGVADGDLVSEAADRVAAAERENWTAVYRLAGGRTGLVARSRDPGRAVYVFPAGRLIHTPAARIRCTTEIPARTSPADGGDGSGAVCTATSPAAEEPDDVPASTGMISPAAILDMLEAAAIDPTVAVTSRETTIAGRFASCLRLGGVDPAPTSDFDVCVTVDGTIAAFTGTVSGTPVEMMLTEFRTATDDRDFAIPANARFVDHRPD